MIDTIARRRLNLNGKTYQKGETVPMPLAQFEDLEPTGLVERATKKAAAHVAKAPTEPKPAARAD